MAAPRKLARAAVRAHLTRAARVCLEALRRWHATMREAAQHRATLALTCVVVWGTFAARRAMGRWRLHVATNGLAVLALISLRYRLEVRRAARPRARWCGCACVSLRTCVYARTSVAVPS